MIRTVKATNYLNESIEFELTNPKKSGFYIREITGLGPPLANINSTEIATSDGAIYNSARITSRNIVLTLGFLFKQTIEDVRQLSYKYFPLKTLVRLTITTDNRIGEVYGYVESNEPDIFSDQQTTKISIICPDPFLYSESSMVTSFSGVDPMFEFPFSNESLIENLLIMGIIRNDLSRNIFYQGDSEIGVIIRIFVFGPVSQLVIYKPGTDQRMGINDEHLVQLTGSELIEGDQIVISTVRGDKYIVLLRAGVEYNILNTLNRNAYWFTLKKGDNLFSYTAEYGLDKLMFQIENRIIYEGI